MLRRDLFSALSAGVNHGLDLEAQNCLVMRGACLLRIFVKVVLYESIRSESSDGGARMSSDLDRSALNLSMLMELMHR